MRPSNTDLKLLLLALKRNPEDSNLQKEVAEFFFLPRFRPDTIKFYRSAIEQNPWCIWHKVYLAKAFYFKGKYREMAALLDYIFDQKDFPLLAYVLKAHLLCIEEKYNQAEEVYLKAVKLNRLIQDKWLENRLWGLRFESLQMAR